MEDSKIVAVTGSHSGMGYAILENLLQNTDFRVIMVSRKEKRGEVSLDKLKSDNPEHAGRVFLEKLDLLDNESIHSFISRLKDKFGGIDVLVNNASMFVGLNYENEETIKKEIDTNLINTNYLIEKALESSLINKNGKIINVSSLLGHIINLKSVNSKMHEIMSQSQSFSWSVYEKHLSTYLDEISDFANRKSWPQVYHTTKMFLSIATYLYSKDERVVERGIQVYSACPGYSINDLMAKKEDLSKVDPEVIKSGADDISYLINLPFVINPNYQGYHFQKKSLTSLLE